MGDRRWLLLLDIDGGTSPTDDLVLSAVLPAPVLGVVYGGSTVAGVIGFSASGGVTPYTFTISAGSLPTGLSLNASTGAITGTPTSLGADNGYFEFTATVTDSTSPTPLTDSKVYALTVTSGIVVSGAMPPGEVGIAYSAGFSATGGTPPYTWTLPSGSLPGGLGPINSSTGIIAGTPTTPGVFSFTVRATDSASIPQDFPTSISIAAAVSIAGSTFPAGLVGVFYNAGPTTVGGVAPFSYSISSGAIPSGCNFSPTTGFVTGTPDTTASYSFDLTVLDVLGGTDTFSAAVTISNAGGAGITTINTISPDGGGNFTLESTDGSATLTPVTNGIDISVTGSATIRARLATAAALPTNTYLNGVSGVGATLTGVGTGTLTVDGKVTALGDVLLVQTEAAPAHNGAYQVTVAGAIGVAYVLTRVAGMNQAAEFTGTLVSTGPDGTANFDTIYECTAISPVTVGATAITFQSVGTSYTPPVTTKGDLFGFSTVPARIAVGSNGQSPIADSAQTTGIRYADAFRGPGCIFSNGSLVLSGTLTDEVQVPYGGTITGWTIVGDVSGSASIVVSHSTYSAYDTMTTLFTATVTTAKKNQATGLSNAIAKGDILRFSGSGFSSFTRCSIVLSVTP